MVPPLKKALENRYRVEMHAHSPIFHGQLKEEKNETDNFYSLGAREGGKKGQTNEKIFFLFKTDIKV